MSEKTIIELLDARIEKIRLNNHTITVLTPKKLISYEEGKKRIKKILETAKTKK